MLEIADVHVYLGKSHILQGVNLEVGKTLVSLIGRNGMGKTSLCKTIMGLFPVAEGSIRYRGIEIAGKKPYEIARLGLGYVPQGRRIFPSLTVDEHLRLTDRREAAGGVWTIERVYELFPGLAERKQNLGANLSGGEQQMLAIGRVLAANPSMLILDEPTEGIAPALIETLIQVFHHIVSEQIGILMIEQNLHVATSLADSVSIMVNGRILMQMESERLLRDEDAKNQLLGVSSA
ncbi:MAG: ABC transporter ATP-binding protein [Spirochaetaceae bacterium]|nr:MAG: ABC transporter ATP-binding protein [Spirochaetaceae bacterium]